MPYMNSLHRHFYPLLVEEIHNSIMSSFQNTNLSEPNIIAKFMYEIVQRINNLQLSTIRAGGVFIHSSPLVSCRNFPNPSPASVELGDLLLVRSEIIPGSPIKRAALLLQAKKVNQFRCMPNNGNQYFLYSNWPTFKYIRIGRQNQRRGVSHLIGKSRTILSNDIGNATKYLLIKIPYTECEIYPFCFSHFCCIPLNNCTAVTAIATTNELSYHECFAYELFKFILGFGGKQFSLPPRRRSRNWDRVIEDLFKNVASLASDFTRRASDQRNSARGILRMFFHNMDNSLYENSIFHSFGINTADRNDEPPSNNDNDFDINEPSGISILEFIMSHEERLYE